jgi:hypothetical protein
MRSSLYDTRMKLLTPTTCAILVLVGVAAQTRAADQMPAGMTHEQHLKQMAKDEALQHRGAEAMGFDQAATIHHFRLSSSGGAIEVTVKDQADEANRQFIRSHLKEIADQFTAGDFAKPLMTHGEMPDGVAEMARRRGVISYAFEAWPDGGRVRIETTDRNALDAVHRFLRYQIREHKTGDSLTVIK